MWLDVCLCLVYECSSRPAHCVRPHGYDEVLQLTLDKDGGSISELTHRDRHIHTNTGDLDYGL